MKEKIDALRVSFEEKLAASATLGELDALRVDFLGKKGYIGARQKCRKHPCRQNAARTAVDNSYHICSMKSEKSSRSEKPSVRARYGNILAEVSPGIVLISLR